MQTLRLGERLARGAAGPAALLLSIGIFYPHNLEENTWQVARGGKLLTRLKTVSKVLGYVLSGATIRSPPRCIPSRPAPLFSLAGEQGPWGEGDLLLPRYVRLVMAPRVHVALSLRGSRGDLTTS